MRMRLHARASTHLECPPNPFAARHARQVTAQPATEPGEHTAGKGEEAEEEEEQQQGRMMEDDGREPLLRPSAGAARGMGGDYGGDEDALLLPVSGKRAKKPSTLLTVCPFILSNEFCERLAFYG